MLSASLYVWGYLWRVARPCKVDLLGAEHFGIPVNSLQLCSGIQLGFLEKVWSIWVLLVYFVGRSRTEPSQMLVILHVWGQTLLSTIRCTGNDKLSPSSSGNWYYSWPCVSSVWFLPLSQVVSLFTCIDPSPAEYSQEALCRSLGFSFSAEFSSLVVCPTNFTSLGLPEPTPCLLNS